MNPARFLLDLQTADVIFVQKIRDFKQLRKEIGNRGGLPEMQEAEEDERANAVSAKLRLARLESNIVDYEDSMKSANERLYSGSITNEREVQALKTEHDSAKQKFDEAKQEAVNYQRASEEAQIRLEEISQKVKDIEENWGSQLDKLKKDRKEILQEITELTEERREISSKIAPEFLNRYLTLIKITKGMAVVKIHRSTCQGCNVRLPIGEISKAKSLTTLTFCSNCGRILLQE